jgi:hypothetical protein
LRKRRIGRSGLWLWCFLLALAFVATLLGSGSAAADERRVFSVVTMEGLRDTVSGMRELEPTKDGGLLVTINEVGVLHVDRRWRVTLVAGQRRGDSGGVPWFSGDGGPATKARVGVAGLAALPDGGFLIADPASCRIRKVDARGIITTVAGSGPAYCNPSFLQESCYSDTPCPPSVPTGDGGQARAAKLLGPSGVAETADGGFLVAETYGHRIRRIAPDGTISTVAGTGEVPNNFDTPRPPYTGQATAAVLRYPSEIEPTADGGFLFSDWDGVHKVDPDGLIRTLKPAHPVGRVYKIADDGRVFDTYLKLSEFRDGAFLPLIRLRFNRGFFPAWGDRLPYLNMRECCLWDAEPIEGGAVVATTLVDLLLIAPPGTNRLGAAIARETLPALQHRRLVVRSTHAAKLRVSLFRRGKLAAIRRASARPGLTRISLPAALPSGLYRAKLQATASDGAQVRETRRLLVGPFLTRQVARGLIDEVSSGLGDEYSNRYVRGCKRFGRRRVDCISGERGNGEFISPRQCVLGLAAVLRRTGYVMVRRYRCGARRRNYFSARPSWIGPAVQAPSLESID